jgi:hypothetical protein
MFRSESHSCASADREVRGKRTRVFEGIGEGTNGRKLLRVSRWYCLLCSRWFENRYVPISPMEEQDGQDKHRILEPTRDRSHS